MMALAPIARTRRRSELSLGLLVVIVDGRRLHPRRAGQRTEAAARPLRAARVRCSASTSSPTSRSGASRRSPTRRCSRSPRCSTASGSSRSRGSTATRHGFNRCGSRSASRCSSSRSSSSATSGYSSGTATRSRSSASARCCCRSLRASAAPINGSRLWVAIGSLTFEPSEIAKVLLVAFFAAYLVDKRELLTYGRRSRRPLVRSLAA